MSATIAVFDLDRTVTRAGTYSPFLLHCSPPGGARAWRTLQALAAMGAYVMGATSRGTLKARMLELFIAGASQAQVAAWAEAFVTVWVARHVRPGALAAIARHKAAGDRLVLATASFDFYAQVFGTRLGFDDVVATASVWDADGRLCAAVDGENCYGAAKLAAVQSYVGTWSERPHVTAYSDHHSDFALLQWADVGVAVNPNAKLRKLAAAHNMRSENWDRI